MDFYRGYTRGRIYRIVPEEPRTVRQEKPNLGAASTEALVALLDHSNGWHRRTAHRLLFERQDEASVPLLREMAVRAKTPQGRIHALWVLEGLSALEASLVEAALEASHPGVRRNAVQLAEHFLPELTPSLIARVDDDSPQVQLQLALTLGRGDRRTARGSCDGQAGGALCGRSVVSLGAGERAAGDGDASADNVGEAGEGFSRVAVGGSCSVAERAEPHRRRSTRDDRNHPLVEGARRDPSPGASRVASGVTEGSG